MKVIKVALCVKQFYSLPTIRTTLTARVKCTTEGLAYARWQGNMVFPTFQVNLDVPTKY